MTHSPSAIQGLLAEHGLEASRALGQNFMADANTVRKIVRLAGVGAGDRVVEVGAGLGSLTLALLEAGAEVTAIEVDRRLAPVLRSIVEPGGATVIEADAMELDWVALLGPPDPTRPWTLVANLPYNIATPLVLDLLADAPAIQRMLVLVQLEVGERLAAGPGTKTYGIPSLKRAWWADAAVVAKVAPTVFIPQPRVDSALVDLRRHAPAGTDEQRAVVFDLVATGFGQRRKMLRRSLADKVQPGDLEAVAINPEARAEELTLADWLRLADVCADVGS
ncbi:MAG: 16S rRNA (adenine(1518)-N(6)/adenine(1519)-N(6))-dimethyltransferase RsmA [Acidimicrobiales bacterium]